MDPILPTNITYNVLKDTIDDVCQKVYDNGGFPDPFPTPSEWALERENPVQDLMKSKFKRCRWVLYGDACTELGWTDLLYYGDYMNWLEAKISKSLEVL